MRGFPKVLKTRFDYVFIADQARQGKLPKDVVVQRIEGLRGDEYIFVPDRPLADGEDPDEGCVAQDLPDDEGRIQLRRAPNPNPAYKRLGMTSEDVDELIAYTEAE